MRKLFVRKMWFCLLSAGIILCLVSCSSPEKDGIKAAKMMYSYQEDYVKKRNEITKEQNKAYESYIKKFDSYSFKTRVEAREKLSEYLEKSKESFQKLENDYREWMNKAYEYRNKLASKYQTDREKESKFSYAYNNYSPKERSSNMPQEDTYANQRKAETMIQSIIPSKPDLEQLKSNLMGRTINNQTARSLDSRMTGYSEWKINSLDELKDLKIQNATEKGDEYSLQIHLPLQGVVNKWDANIYVKYVLGRNDDWILTEFYGNMNIVPTGKYDKYIKTQLVNEKYGFGFSRNILGFTNNSNERLIVEGEILRRGQSNWGTFSIIVAANEKKTLTSKSLMGNTEPTDVSDYKITFVERSGL